MVSKPNKILTRSLTNSMCRNYLNFSCFNKYLTFGKLKVSHFFIISDIFLLD